MLPKYTFLHEFEPEDYAIMYLRTGMSESAVQTAILGYLASKRIFAFPVDVGAKQLQGRAFGALRRAGLGTAALKGKTGAGEKGVSDIIGVLPEDGRALFIEVKKPAHYVRSQKVRDRWVLKSPAGEASQEQLDFLDRAHRSGAVVGVAWSVGDVEYILSKQ
jgi:hypothetical protein